MATLPKAEAFTQTGLCVTSEHPAETGTVTVKVMQCTRAFIVDSVRYVNHTGLAEDASNTFAGTAAKGTTPFATLFNTLADAGPDHSLAANTWVAGVLDADSTKREFEPGDELNLILTLGGSQTLPAGHVVVEGRYL